MTVRELKALLEDKPDDMIVVQRGYEDHYDDIKGVKPIEIILNGNTHIWYYGTHIEKNESIELRPGQSYTPVLLIQ